MPPSMPPPLPRFTDWPLTPLHAIHGAVVGEGVPGAAVHGVAIVDGVAGAAVHGVHGVHGVAIDGHALDAC